MKRLLLLFSLPGILMISGMQVHAQGPAYPMGIQLPSHASLKQFRLPFRNTRSLQKPTELQSRMNALSIAMHDGASFVPNDSIQFYWSGTRAANFSGRDVLELFIGPGFINNELPAAPIQMAFTPNSDSFYNYYWNDIAGSYDPSEEKTLITLDPNGNITGMLSQEYDGANWVNDYRYTYTYDANNNCTEVLEDSWNGGAWENDYRTLYTFDQNNLTEAIEQNWDNVGSAWENNNKALYTYDSEGNWTSAIYQYWDAGAWVNNARNLYEYSAGNRIMESGQDWDAVLNDWENDYKPSFSYGSAGERLTDIYQDWNTGMMSWDNQTKYTYTYNASGDQLSTIMQDWVGGAWENMEKYNYEYAGNLLATMMLSSWDNVAAAFKNSFRLNFTYNGYDQMTLASTQTWNPGEFWEEQSGETRFSYYYEEYDDGVGIAEVSSLDFALFPNPASSELIIDAGDEQISGVQIMEISGRVVYQSRHSLNASRITIPVRHLADGVYILQLRNGKQNAAKPFVVSH